MWKAFDMKLERVSGKYVQQPQGYKAFVPEPLPPEPAVRIDERMNTALSRADRALGRLDGSIETLPHPELFLSMFVRREAVLSSQIEGTQASLSDVIKAEADIADRARPSDVLEVQNCMAAIERGTQLLKDLPISTRLITELHRILMTGVRGEHQNPGEIRESQNWIGPAGCTLFDALFIPPPRNEVHRLLGQLENFLHDESPIPPLIRIGLAHAQFETIHPFLDGNGRVGRLLITLFLVEKTLLRRPVLYLSYYFKRHRAEYYDRLQGIRDRGDWEAWLYFFLEGVAQVANLAAETAQKVLRLREDHRQVIIDTFERASATPLRVLDKLYRLPVTSANVVMSDIGTSYPTANNIVRQLEKIGILREMTGQRRNRFYLYQTYMSLFDEL
ncbi:MAG TPA: Fic family protein [Sphingomicrobium sp.]|nr:Fic family protein [Sphingomicrobium sp.]